LLRGSDLKKRLLFYTGLTIIILIISCAVFAPLIAPVDPTAINVDKILSPPDKVNILGTDDLGRDVFSRLVYASRISIKVGFVAVGISALIGTILGSVAGFFGGITDMLIMRLVDIMLCFPAFFLILAVIAYLEPSIVNIMLIIGATSWMGICRMVRAEILSLKTREFVLSAKVSGASPVRILFIHILPNVLPVILVYATLGIGGAILTESALSFIGLGVQPPVSSWGNMLMAGKDNIDIAWWLSFFPGAAIFITIIAFNFVGEGLQDMLNPKEK
jgi:peptide/nickel transport system permease protein